MAAPVKVVKSLRTKVLSPAVQAALSHVKDFMTDVQKSIIILREGRTLFDNGHIQDALDCFNEAISLHPSVTLFHLRAACHKYLEQFAEAYFDYSFCIRLEPDVGAHYCSRGLCLAKLRKLSLAVEDFNLAILYDPSGMHYFARGSVLADFDKHLEAIEDFTAALKDDLQSSEFKIKCRYRRALAYFNSSQYNETIVDATEVLKHDANSVPARSLLGRAFKVIHEYQKAEEQLTNAILIDDSQPALYTERGDIRFRTNQKNKIIEAIYDFDKTIQLLEAKLLGENSTHSHSHHRVAARSSSDDDLFVDKHYRPHRRVSVASVASTMSAHQQEIKAETEAQMADALYKRAQAKLLIESEAANIESALIDALRAMTLGNDEDYELVTASCYIRLRKYTDAVAILEKILARSPKNLKALYNLSFCRRAAGLQKEAIADLTKIIATNASKHDSLAIPMHRVYEMRGTLFHEVQAHKLSLLDLGKAIAINPSHAVNYFLRADCHYKLGNYEQALQDYDQTEMRGFPDLVALYISRGMTKRVVKDFNGALEDFDLALELMDRNDQVNRVRTASFIALCHIDLKMYKDAIVRINVALQDNDELLKTYLDETPRPKDEILYCRRTGWILLYHKALCLYMIRSEEDAEQTLERCVDHDHINYAPDEASIGVVQFFLGELYMSRRNYAAALQCFEQCGGLHWADTPHHRYLLDFAIAKCYQSMKQHVSAIERFTEIIEQYPEDAYSFFRRAWSYKATGNYLQAGDDFETAKRLKPEDPNFALDYKKISKFEFMIIATEPDLIEPFPSLLPVPGLQSR